MEVGILMFLFGLPILLQNQGPEKQSKGFLEVKQWILTEY